MMRLGFFALMAAWSWRYGMRDRAVAGLMGKPGTSTANLSMQ
jgi:hypothetical protein